MRGLISEQTGLVACLMLAVCLALGAGEVIDECVTVAAEAGILLNREDVEGRLLQTSQHSNGQLISTLVYIWQGRETEIDTLDLAVARLTEKLDKTHLATRNKLIGELTKLKAEVYRAQSLNGLTPTKVLRYLLTLFTRRDK